MQPAASTAFRVRVLSLDLDDTLWEMMPVIVAAERELRAWLKQNCPKVTARYSPHQARALRGRLVREHPERAHDLSWLRLLTLETMLMDCGYDCLLAEEAFRIFLEARNRVSLHPDVLPALEALHGRYTLVALTNGNADLERVGLARFFDHYVSARAVGAAKPDARMFAAVAEATGYGAESILHVGDDPVCDIVGAASAGMRTVWINRDGAAWPAAHPPPDAHVTDLLRLARLLREA